MTREIAEGIKIGDTYYAVASMLSPPEEITTRQTLCFADFYSNLGRRLASDSVDVRMNPFAMVHCQPL